MPVWKPPGSTGKESQNFFINVVTRSVWSTRRGSNATETANCTATRPTKPMLP